MALTAGELQILVNVNTQEIEKLKAQLMGVEQQAKKSQLSFAKLAGSFFTAQTAMNLFSRGLQLGKEQLLQSIRNAKDLGEETNKFKVVFKGVTEDAFKMRDSLVKSYGMSRVEATRTLGAFQDFLVPMGVARDKGLELSGAFTKLAVDIGSFNNAPTVEVIDAIKSGIAGMSRPMRRFGVDISETTLKQMAMAQGIELVGGKLDNQTRAQLIYQKILKDSADANEDFIRTSDQLANRLKILDSVQQDISSSLGTTLLPIINKMAGSFLDGAKSVRDWLSEEKNLNKVFKGIKGVAIVFYSLGKAIQLNFKIMKDFFITPWIIAGKVLWEFIKPLASLVDGVKKAADKITKFLAPALEKVSGWFGKAKDKAKEFTDSVGIDFQTKLPKGVTNGLNVLQEELKKTGKSYIKFTKDSVKGLEELKELQLDVGESAETMGTGGGAQEEKGQSYDEWVKEMEKRDAAIKKRLGAEGAENKIQISFDIGMFESSASMVSNVIGNVSNTFVSSFQDAFNKISDENATFAQKFAAVFTAIGKTVQSVISGVGEMIDEEYSERLDKLTELHDAEIEAIDEKLAREIELIENNGITKKEALQNEIITLQDAITQETDIQKKADLEEELSEKNKELAILQAQEAATKKKEETDKKYAKKKYKVEVEQFNTKKALDITQASISYALGLVSLWANVWSLGPIAGAIMGGIMSGLLTGIYASQVAMIASQQPPPPPKFARGGISSGGGALVGEEGAEYVNLPRGAQVFPAKDTSEMLNPNFTIENKLYIGEDQMALATSRSNKDNLRYETARR